MSKAERSRKYRQDNKQAFRWLAKNLEVSGTPIKLAKSLKATYTRSIVEDLTDKGLNENHSLLCTAEYLIRNAGILDIGNFSTNEWHRLELAFNNCVGRVGDEISYRAVGIQ